MSRPGSELILATALIAALASAPSHGAGAAARISLRWKPVEGAAGYELEIARDPQFRQIVLRQRTRVAGYRWDELPRTQYFWRVRSLDADNRAGEWSDTEKIDPAVAAPEPASPREGTVLTLTGRTLDLEVAAHASPLLREYIFELSRDPSFGQGVQVRRSAAATAHFTLDGLGTWHWRVRATDLSGRGAGASAAQRVEVRLGPPDPESPPNGVVLGWAGGSSNIALRWKPQPRVRGYVVEITEGGASRVVRAQSPQLEWAVSEPMPISWRVAALDPSGRQTAFSASRTLTFALGKAAPVAPSAKAVVRVRDPSSPVGFTWTLPEGATGADIEVARGATFSAPIVRLKVQGSSAEAALPGPGAYLWRVSPRGPRGLAFGASEPTPFEVKLAERLPAPVLSEPAHDSVLPADLRGVRVSWREVPGAQRYEVQIDGGPATSAASAAGPARVLEGISEGEHTVRVRAVDELNLASAWSDPVPFHFGAPRTASVEFRLGGELAANGESASDLRFRLLDSRGRIIRDVRPAVYVSAGVVEAVMPDPEGFRLRYQPPDIAPAGGEAELRIEDRGFAATARLKLARHRPRVQLGIRAGWSTQFAALSSPYLGMDATWEPGWWNNHLALSARAGLHGGSAVVRFPEIGATYSVQTRVVPVTALLLYQSALAGCQARMGAGGGVQLVRSWIGERSELVATPSATAVAGLSRRIGVGRALVEVGYTLGFTEGAVARGHTGGLVTTFGYGVDL